VSAPDNLDQLQPDAYLLRMWRLVVGGDLPMQPHIAVYGRQRRDVVHVVLRSGDGWRLLGPRNRTYEAIGVLAHRLDRTYEVIADPGVLAHRLAGLSLLAGTPAAELTPIAISEPPSFDHRWLPPLPAILDHLPAYSLRLRPTSDGFAMSESGVPLAAPLLTAATYSATDQNEIKDARGQAVLRRDGPALRQRHARAIAALRRTIQALESRDADADALLTPSAVLAAAGTDPSELASLCNGAVPDAARLDRLGYFHPSGWPHEDFSWLIPLTDGLFLECCLGECDFTLQPRTEQRPPTAEELEELRPRKTMSKPKRVQEPLPPDLPTEGASGF
jgi:hypothetical protein